MGDRRDIQDNYYHVGATFAIFSWSAGGQTCQTVLFPTLNNTVICFCKHPEVGRVKTRLSIELGAIRAAEIYKITLEHTLRNICGYESKIALYCHPDSDHLFLSDCRDKYHIPLYNQEGSDLGARMFNAINRHLSAAHPVTLIGSDCLEIDINYIRDAFLALEAGNEIVLGPTLDGGYALIGVKNQLNESIFNDITWSTGSVLQQTKAKIERLGWPFACMPPIRDIDTPADYRHFTAHKKFKHLFSSQAPY